MVFFFDYLSNRNLAWFYLHFGLLSLALGFWCCFFSTRSFFHAIYFLLFSISHLASFCLGLGMRYLSTQSAPWSSWLCVFRVLLRPSGLLSFGVFVIRISNWFCVLFLLGFLVTYFFPKMGPLRIVWRRIFYVTWHNLDLRYKRRHKLLATSITGLLSRLFSKVKCLF